MAQLHITLDEATLKDLMLGNRDQAVSKLLEEVFNAILKMEATEQLGAQAYERTEERQTYRNGYRTRMLTTRVGTLTLHIPKFRDGTFSTELCVLSIKYPGIYHQDFPDSIKNHPGKNHDLVLAV